MIRAAERLERLLEPLLAPLGRLFPRLHKGIAAQSVTDLLLFAVALVLALVLAIEAVALVVGVGLALHVGVGRRRARVFISFQHDRESVADGLSVEMGRRRMDVVKLPFVETPHHDTLLDAVRDGIRGCDVFVCLPGSRSSFVESEVSMAFGLEKPLLFIVSDADTPRLPNTAKKGYPVFDLERLEAAALVPLINFSSYLAADWKSTVRLYAAVFRHIGKCLILLAPVYFLSLVSALLVIGPTRASPRSPASDPSQSLESIQSFLSDPLIYCFVASCLVLFLVPYGLFFASRRVARARIRRTVSARRFSESFLPEVLDSSLARKDLLGVLYLGDMLAEHESALS
jgi:hypothetical protein